MTLTMSALISPLVMALYDFKEPVHFASLYIFEPPNCEHQVVFPYYPQKVGVLQRDEKTYSAQLSMKDSFLRADCQSVELPAQGNNKAMLESLLTKQIEQLGGDRIQVLEYDINDKQATYTGQVIINEVSIMVSGGFYIGNNSLMSLTAIDKYKIQSSKATEKFIGSASLHLPYVTDIQ